MTDEPASLPPLASAAYAILSGLAKVPVPVAELAGRLRPSTGPPDASPGDEGRAIDPGLADALAGALDALAGAGLVDLWPDGGDCTLYGDRGPLVTLSALSAHRLGLKLNRLSTRWMPVTAREAQLKVRRQQLDGADVVPEADMAIDPPGQLAQVEDRRDREAAEAAAELEARIARAKDRAAPAAGRIAELGLPAPAVLLGLGPPWPLAGQDRGPWGPDPGVHDRPPRRSPVGAGAPPPALYRAGVEVARLPAGDPPAPPAACGGCGGRVREGELCAACLLYFADARLPPTVAWPPDAGPGAQSRKGLRDLVTGSAAAAIRAEREGDRKAVPGPEAAPEKPTRKEKRGKLKKGAAT